MYRSDLYVGAVGGGPFPRSLLRILRIYLGVTTAMYALGVGFTLFPINDSATLANPLGGLIAIGLGAAAMVWLWVRPDNPTPAVIAACAATPTVMAFHVLIAAEFLCMVAAMFLAMYLRATYPRPRAWTTVGLLTAACVVALAIAPTPKYFTTYVIVAVAIPAAAESFGMLTRTLLTAACTDPLTGVLNRAGWELVTTTLLDRHRGGGRKAVTVIALDIDDFKTINDTRGHHAGDQHLIAYARTCTDLLPRDAVIARLGGDEFAICVIHDDDSPSTAEEFVAELRRLLPDTTFGDATAPVADAEITELHSVADLALTAAKRDKRRHLRPRTSPEDVSSRQSTRALDDDR